MIHICKELKKIINEVEKENQVLSINLIIYEILKMYKEYFGLKKQDIETIYKGNEVDVDAKLYNKHFFSELEENYPSGINSIFDILVNCVSKESDLKYDLLNIGVSYRKIIDIRDQLDEEIRFIEKYTTNISLYGINNDINIVERTKELELLEIFLSMKTKNNVLITGKPGVGKTTLVEAFAQKINKGMVRPKLCGKQILSVDIARLLGNTKYRGEFEEKLTKLLDICVRNEHILFIDEAHIVIGAGASEGGISASNILKPYLLNSKLRFICATTEDECKLIKNDKALNRRFNSINLEEFSKKQMFMVAKKLSEPYEKLQQIGSILGSIVTGLLLSQINVVYILFFDSVSFLLSAVIIINMDKSTVIELKESKNNVVQSFRSGLSYILNKKTIMLLIIICGAPSFVVNVLNTLLCEYTEVILGLSVGEYSILDASFGVGCVCMGGIIAFFLSNKEENKLGFIGYLLIPISMFALSITRTFYIAIFEIVFLGALIMVVSINAKTLFAKIVDKEYIGRVDSYSYTINSLFVSLSGIFAGFLSGIINVSWIFRLYSVVCIIFVICYVTLLNKLQMTSKFRE